MTDVSTYYDESYPPSIYTPPEPPPEPTYALPDDIAHFTIAEVQDWVGDDPERAQQALDAELARGEDARTTLVAWLEAIVETPEE